MKLPFLQHCGIGIYVTARAVRWIELARVRERVWIRRYAREPVREEQDGERRALARLIRRVQPAEPFVATHLPPAYVREYSVDVPHFDDEAARRAWIEQDAAERLPAAVRAEDFVIRYRRLHGGQVRLEAEEGATPQERRGGLPAYGRSERRRPRYWVAMARRHVVEARVEMLRDLGLTPVYVGTLTPLLGYAFGFAAAFDRGRSAALLLHADGGRVGLFSGGRMVDLQHVSGPANRSATREEVRHHLATWKAEAEGRSGASIESDPLPLYVMGEGADAALAACRTDDAEWGQRPVRSIEFLTAGAGEIDGEEAGEDEPGAADGPALGLAAGMIYGTEDLNLIDPEEVRAARYDRDKRDALRVMLGAGLGVLVLLIGAVATTFWLRHQIAEAEAALARAEDRIARVEAAEAALGQLRVDLGQAHRLAQRRTRAAAVLAHVSGHVPQDLWMQTVRVEADERASAAARDAEPARQAARDRAMVVLEGWALDERAPNALVGALEESPGFHGVQPTYVERLPASEVARISRRAWRQALIRFEVRAQVPLVE